MRVLPCGDAALLVEAGDVALGVYAALLDEPLDGVTDLVPAASTVLVRFSPAVVAAPELARRLASVRPVSVEAGSGELVTVPVHYDGADLAEVGLLTGLGVSGVIEAHAAARYVVAFSGFAPGFGYLTGLDPRLRLPRRSTPRVRVPAGAVGVAGEFTGVYPRSSPGGWHLLGRTSVPLWDPRRSPPALLRPGTRVRFEPVAALRSAPAAARSPAAAGPAGVEVVRCGPLATVQVGVRLSGARLARSRSAELPGEGVVPGAIQVPPSGQPVVFLADHPVTGGYPVIAVVRSADLPVLAQARPGQRVSFRC